MKCNQTQRLVSSYLDHKLDRNTTCLFEEHIAGCSRCMDYLLETRSIYKALEYSGKALVAPVDFASCVMESINQLDEYKQLDRRKVQQGNENTWVIHRPVLRRLGVSLILMACIMLFSISVQMGTGNYAAGKEDVLSDKSMQVTDIIYDIDYSVRSFFRDISNSIEKLRED